MQFNKPAATIGTVRDAVSFLLRKCGDVSFTALKLSKPLGYFCTSGRLPVEVVIWTWQPPMSITTTGRIRLSRVFVRRHGGKGRSGHMFRSLSVKSAGRRTRISSIPFDLLMPSGAAKGAVTGGSYRNRSYRRWSMPDWGHNAILPKSAGQGRLPITSAATLPKITRQWRFPLTGDVCAGLGIGRRSQIGRWTSQRPC